jgi:hypothetical protein
MLNVGVAQAPFGSPTTFLEEGRPGGMMIPWKPEFKKPAAVEREYEYFYESPVAGIHLMILNSLKLWRRTLFCGVIIALT